MPSRIGFRIFPALLWIILSIFAAPAIGYANNATVANVALGSRYGEDGYMQIQFDLSWDNSWRNNVCRDAVWIFAKYKVTSNGTWNHCTLKVVTPNVSGYTVNPTNYSVGTEAAGQIPQIVVPSDKRGCFVERASTGAGDMDITSIKILWDWATDGLTKTSTIYQIKVFAIEMTYIPLSAFGVGAAQDACAEGEFSMGAWFNFPGSITSENAKTLYFSWDTSFLGNHDSCGMATADDFGSITSQTLPAAFPKGYNAFYLMKYEISQGQYTDFLNSLSRGQENNRVGSNITADAPTDGSIYVMSSTTGISYRNTILCPSNGNGTTNSITFSTTRPDRACNWLSWMDLAAFADWTGLRPMTELEFEKAARGNNWTYDDNEYAW
ncbi:MAG: SUMF1/EgtB/PvdO family nonheme iron enzyme, partial [Candidatus Omnitrophota bacterium]